MNRDFKGIWIPKEIWLSEELNVMEKLFLVEIDSLDGPIDGCYASNDYFSKFFSLSKNRCSEIIKNLEGKGFLSIDYVYKTNTKAIEKRILRVLDKSNWYSKNREGYSKNTEDNNTINNINNIYIGNKQPNRVKEDLFKDFNEEVITALKDFIEFRKKIKKPLTDRALKLLINRLNSFNYNDELKIRCIEKAILQGWSNIYKLNVEEEIIKPKEVIVENEKYDNPCISEEYINRYIEEQGKNL